MFPSHLIRHPESLFFFWKARVALHTLLEALDVGPGDEVIMPAFTCVVVPNAILYRGASPIYADIDPDTFNISAESVESLITPRTRVILAQNTFGLSPDLDPIMSLAERHGIIVIDDCAHGLGAGYKGQPAGMVAHAAIYSLQWSKPVSTGLGGFAYIRDKDLAQKVSVLMDSMPYPGLAEQAILAAQISVRPLAKYTPIYYGLVAAYRFLTQRLNLRVGSSVHAELSSIDMPPRYALRMAPFQNRLFFHRLRNLEHRLVGRKEAADGYDRYFSRKSIQLPARPGYAEHGMLRYSIRVRDKDAVLRKARKFHIPLGDWFVSPLHPVQDDLSLWRYKKGQCPTAEKACQETINILTDVPLSTRQLDLLFGSD